MKKFLILLQKEIKELLTLQMIAPLIFVVILFALIGNVIGKETQKIQQPKEVAVLDEDSSTLTLGIVEALKASNMNVDVYTDISKQEAVDRARNEGNIALIYTPKDLESKLLTDNAKQIESYFILKSFSLISSQNSVIIKQVLASINDYVSSQVISKAIPASDPIELKNPIKSTDFVVVGEKTVNISPEVVTNFVMSQTTFIPIILFIVIIMASQMIATSVASEKENKTLETLLSLPIGRGEIVAAKLVGAGIVALLLAGVYMFGFKYYLNGITGTQGVEMTEQVKQAVDILGLNLTLPNYVLLGSSLFFGILAALSVAMILGLFAEDTKAVQSVISPLMVLVAIPYFLVLFLDFNSLSVGLKYLVYAIPFSHPFLAAPNIFLKNYNAIYYGIAYQFIFFLVFVYIASRIFSTDRIITIKLNFSKKKSEKTE